MSKFRDNFRKYRKTYIFTFVISFLVGIAVFCLYFFLNGYFVISALNGVSIAAVVLVALGGLMWVQSQGAFDTISYGFRQMFSSFFSKTPNKYNDMYSYKQAKIEKRDSSPKTFFAILFAAAVFALAIIALEIVYHIH